MLHDNSVPLKNATQAAYSAGGGTVYIPNSFQFWTFNSTLDFTEQHLVTNGASELVADVFGERGKHARSAFGVAQIPLGACVEIEMIAEVE